MNSAISGKILGVSDKSYYLLDNLKTVSVTTLVVDVFIVAGLFYMLYLFLYETRALRILYGLIILLLLMTVGQLFNFILLNWILKYVTAMLVVAIPVVFQPELRGALEKLGRARFIGELPYSRTQNSSIVDVVTKAALSLSSSKIGGLIVFQRKTGLREYIENGVKINAESSKDLFISIFYPRSPLHDGAVIIVGNKIVSARSILPVSVSRTGTSLGTRHQAGVGITENSDAVAVIISEESGAVSLAVSGKIERKITEERLRSRLSRLLRSNRN